MMKIITTEKMRTELRKLGMLVMLLALCNVVLDAQNVALPYKMSFEDSESAELQNWSINPGADQTKSYNLWQIGGATSSDGEKALYISPDGGASARSGWTKDIQYAYRDFLLPVGNYVISFDYRVNGIDGQAMLYSGVMSSDQTLSAVSAGVTLAQLTNNGVAANAAMYLDKAQGQTSWKNTSFSVVSDAVRPLRLYFCWYNTNTDTLKCTLGACIDNIQVREEKYRQPSNLSVSVVTCDSVKFSWTGETSKYLLEYKNESDDIWTSRQLSSTSISNSVYLDDFTEGVYEFRISGIQGTDTTITSTLKNVQITCPESHCIDFANFADPSVATAYTGTFANPRAKREVIDNGQFDEYSRHTVCWTQGYDPRTGDGQTTGLKYIPDGEDRSVRLGNWDTGAEAESIEYLYKVNAATSAILLVKYAVVLESPDHGEAEDPAFLLEILDLNGNKIGGSCGSASFSAGHGDTKSWNSYYYNPYSSYYGGGYGGYYGGYYGGGYGSQILWKDWTTIGLNLEDYDGQTLIIRLTTKDCEWGAHFGYGYFTLGCANAVLETTSCGEDEVQELHAPDGFDYAWYDSKGNYLGNEQTLILENADTTTFRCHLSYIGNSGCGFDLTTKAIPTSPVAEFEANYTPKDCKNIYTFKNKSHLLRTVDGKPKHYNSMDCDEYLWEFSNGVVSKERSPKVTFPEQGGTFTAHLTAYLANGLCFDDEELTINVPAIGDTNLDIDTIVCEGSLLKIGGKVFTESTEEWYNGKSTAGCDSTIHVKVTVIPSQTIVLPDTTICYSDEYCVDGDCFNRLSENFIRTAVNQYGCDSIIYQRVILKDPLVAPEYEVVDEGDMPNTGSISFVGGEGWSYYLVNGEKNVRLDSLVGGTYLIEFINDSLNHICTTGVDTIEVGEGCVSKVVYQRWSDVLSIYNKEQQELAAPRPAYDYLSFQWYKDGVEIPGATESYLYVPEGLDLNANYTCMLGRPDGMFKETCEFYPMPVPEDNDLNLSPTQVEAGGQLKVKGAVEKIVVVTPSGMVYEELKGEKEIAAPKEQGLYIYRLQNSDSSRVFRVNVK